MRYRLVIKPDGTREWVDVNKLRRAPDRATPLPVEGEALGCVKSQVDVMRADAALNGFKSIEFREDPDVKGFYNCWAPDQSTHDRYAEHCGMTVKNGQFSGVTLSEDALKSAERLIRERYPVKGEA